MITVTSTTLLNGLRDRDNARVWDEFFTRYQPVLVAFGKQLGLKEQDAEDAAQDALMVFVRSYREGVYDREKGRLRTWLFGITAHKVRDIQRQRGRQRIVADRSESTRFIDKIPDEHHLSQVWEAEWSKAILQECLKQVRDQVKPQTMQAFELFALQGLTAEKVAEKLGITENAVWIAKNRVVTRMRKIQEQLEEEW